MIAISFIMPCYNRAYDLERVLVRYDEQDTDEEFELIAIDDCSTDRTYEVLCSYQPQHYKLRVLRQSSNQGQASARNRGIEMVESPLVAFVGDDILPEHDFVRCHLEAHRNRPQTEVAILGKVVWGKNLPVNTLMEHIDGEGAQQFSYYYFRDGREYDFRHLYTCNISLKREMLFSEKYWFDGDFHRYGYEDVELGYRLAKHGLRILYQSGIQASHYHYHTIWSFSARQFSSGVSSQILIKKQPALKFHPSFRGHYRKLIAMACQPTRISVEQAARYDRLACTVASYYEWLPNPILSKLYMPLLDYFYYNGVFKAFLGERLYETWGHAAHAQAYLLPALKQFSQHALTDSIPLPPGIDANLW
jgi:glycosyltransferase involved in cell wall biosynthesis